VLLVVARYRCGQRLSLLQSCINRAIASDDCGELRCHLVTKIGELRNVDELDADCGPRLNAGVRRIGVLQRFQSRRGECGGSLGVVRVGVGRGALAGRQRGPTVGGTDQVFVLLRGSPRNELPRCIGICDLYSPRNRASTRASAATWFGRGRRAAVATRFSWTPEAWP